MHPSLIGKKFPSVLSRFLALALIAVSATISYAQQQDASSIVVVAVAGNVSVTMAGVRSDVQARSVVALPAVIVTGANGTIDLRQGETNLSIAPETRVELPETVAAGGLIDRVIQQTGSAFYDVAPRETNRLRVEAPYLVAVVKGTQFNLVIQADNTTISLFEGRLALQAPDSGATAELNAGEIAIRYHTEQTIRVLNADDDDQALEPPPGDASRDGLLGDLAARASADAGLAVNVGASLDTRLDLGDTGSADLGLDGDTSIDAGLDADLDLGGASIDTDLDAGLDLGAGSADLGLDGGLDLGGASIDTDLDAGLDLGAGSADLGLDGGLDLGGASIDAGLDAGLDPGAGGTDLGVEADLGGLLDPDGTEGVIVPDILPGDGLLGL